MNTGNADLDAVLAVIGAVTVLLSVLANVPAVRATKTGEVLVRLTAIDLMGIVRLVAPLFASKKAPPTAPTDPGAN